MPGSGFSGRGSIQEWWRSLSSAARDAVVLLGGLSALTLVLLLDRVDGAAWIESFLRAPGIWHPGEVLLLAAAGLVAISVYAVRRWRELRATTRRLETIQDAVDQLDDSFFIEDLDGTVRFANQATARELDYESADDLVGRNLEEMVPPELLSQWRPMLEELRRTGEPQTTTYRLPSSDDGGHRRTRISPLEADGEVVGLAGTSHDITPLVRARERARLNEDRLQEAQRLARVGSWEWRIPRDEIHWSDELYRIFGVDPEAFEANYEAFLTRVHPEDRERIQEQVGRTLETGEPYEVRFRLIREDGEVRWADGAGELEVDESGEPLLLRGVAQDVTELKEARRKAEEVEQRYRTLFALSPLAFAVSTPEAEIVDVNRSWSDLFGYDREDVLGSDVRSLELWEEEAERERLLDLLEGEGSVRDFQASLRTRTGELREVEMAVDRVGIEGEPHLVWGLRDVTERNEYQRQLERQALHDTLTGLPNRNLLMDRLNHALDRSRRHDESLAVVFVDLDEFKAVNDSYGHAAGDEILRETARRMRGTLRAEDTAARISGDEFVVLLEETNGDAAKETARRLVSALEEPFRVDGKRVSVGASAGVAVRSPGEESGFARGEDLLQAADSAMYRVKQEREGGVRLYTSGDLRHGDRLRRKERLRAGIEGDELVVYYQPIVHLRDDRIVGAEALVRWEHPERGLIPPGEFIPLAEETGLIHSLDEWVLDRAVRRLDRWIGGAGFELPEDFRLALNIAPHRYEEEGLAGRILKLLGTVGISPRLLQLEITERLALKETRSFRELRREGVRLAIDDFGTGYSSLMYLRHLDADALKVDRFFVQELDVEERTSIIIRSVLSIGAHLDLDVIAEGVETADQRDHLEALGCPLAQGYFFARPMPAQDMEELLRSEATLP